MNSNRARNPEEQDVVLEEILRSKGVRIGLGIASLGFLAGMVGVGDLITDSNEYAGEMIVGSYTTMLAGVGVAAVSGVRAVRNYDKSKTQEQNPQP